MLFVRQNPFHCPISSLLTDPNIQSYVDLLTNYSQSTKTLFEQTKVDSSYETFIFAYIENLLLLGDNTSFDQIIKSIEVDTSSFYEWPYWTKNKEDIKKLILKLKERNELEKDKSLLLEYFYDLEKKEDHLFKNNNLQVFLNILMRYLIITYVISNKDKYFAGFNNPETGLVKFLETSKICSLQNGLSELAGGFIPQIFAFNLKIYFWEADETKNLTLKKKIFVAKENWQQKPMISLIQNKNSLDYRILYSKENDNVPLKKTFEEINERCKRILERTNDVYQIWLEKSLNMLKEEILTLFQDEKLFPKRKDKPRNELNFVLEELEIGIQRLEQLTRPNQRLLDQRTEFGLNIEKLDYMLHNFTNDLKIFLLENNESLKNKKVSLYYRNNFDKIPIFQGKNNLPSGNHDGCLSFEPLIKNELIQKKELNNSNSNIIMLKEQKNNYGVYSNIKNDRNFNNILIKNDVNDNNNHQKNQSNFYNPEPQKKKPLNKMECPICSSKFQIDKDIITLDCDHRICKECLQNWLNVKMEMGQWELENFKCFSLNCKQLVDCNIIKHVLGDEKFAKMCDKLAAKYCITCPHCQFQFINELKAEKKINCLNCKKPICAKCNDKQHEGQACPRLFEIAMKALKNEKMNFCPDCFEIYVKDDKCAHVTCFKCSTEFCFECSCYREPTLNHGNHFHRVDCKFYFPKVDMKKKGKICFEDEFEPKKCKLCEKNGRACKRPESYKEFYGKMVGEKKG